MNQEGHFACHLTIPEEECEPELIEEEVSQCAGSILYMIKGGKMPRNLLLQSIITEFKTTPNWRENLENIMYSPEFKNHHKDNLNDN